MARLQSTLQVPGWWCLLFLLIIQPTNGQSIPSVAPWNAPPLEASISIRREADNGVISFETLLKELAEVEVVFLGETHSDETTHRVEFAIYQALLQNKKPTKVVLALEMFERDVQAYLDEYLAGEIDEKDFLQKSRPWGNYREAYRPLIELAKKEAVPVIASNFPTKIRRRIALEGPKVIEKLSNEERALLPKKFYANTEAYWKRVNNVTRSHQGMMPAIDDAQQLLYSAQSLWDNSMGDACANVLQEQPDSLVLHINGGFHSAYGDGTVHQFKLRKPRSLVKTVSIIPDGNPSTVKTSGIPESDYLIIAESRATNLYEAERTVSVEQEMRYRFHLPIQDGNETMIPLLIWLSDDGLTAKESMALWKARLGKEVAIAVVEAPNIETQIDLTLGGRWYWLPTFSEGASKATEGVERIWAYLLRHFPLDPDRVCLAGEGTGATMVASIALHTDRITTKAIAWNPRQFSKLVDLPLPLPELFYDKELPQRSLQVVGHQKDQRWWERELAQYREVGMESLFFPKPVELWQSEQQAEKLIRTTLGLAGFPDNGSKETYYLVVDDQSPKAKHWARLQAHWLAKQKDARVLISEDRIKTADKQYISTKIFPKLAGQPGVIPKCPGPFGGTTVIVLPNTLSLDEQQQWIHLESNDPLAKSSRFHRLRIATIDGDRSLVHILQKLLSENRKNVLVVPALFHANRSWLQALSETVAVFNDTMVIQWLPGLGGRENVLSR